MFMLVWIVYFQKDKGMILLRIPYTWFVNWAGKYHLVVDSAICVSHGSSKDGQGGGGGGGEQNKINTK